MYAAILNVGIKENFISECRQIRTDADDIIIGHNRNFRYIKS